MALCFQGHPLRLGPGTSKWRCNVCKVNPCLADRKYICVVVQNLTQSCFHIRCVLKEVSLGVVRRTNVLGEEEPATMTAASNAWQIKG